MDKLSISLYDALGYLVPGTVLLWIVNLAFQWMFGVAIPIYIGSEWINTIVFLVSAYFLGHLAQGSANSMERFLFECWGGWPSERLLADPEMWRQRTKKLEASWQKEWIGKRLLRRFVCSVYPPPPTKRLHYTPEVAGRLKASAIRYFGLSDGYSNQELFNLCYSTISAKSIPSLVPVFNAFYSLYRGMAVACLLGSAVSLVGWVHGEECWSQGMLTGHHWATLGLSMLFLLSAHLMLGRLRRFAEHFADNVYRTFYVWYQSDTGSRATKRCCVPRKK